MHGWEKEKVWWVLAQLGQAQWGCPDAGRRVHWPLLREQWVEMPMARV